MKIGTLALGSIALLASLSFADDMSRVTPNDHQLLKTCMDRQLSNTSVTISKAEAKRYCKHELKHQKEVGAGPERQPTDAPPAPSDSPAPAMPPPG
jgi:hypothetical protein